MKYILVKPIDATFSCSEGSVVGIEIGLRARTVERERERGGWDALQRKEVNFLEIRNL